MIVTTANDVAGHRIVKYLGLVRGITVRSRSVIGNLAGGIQSLFGGKLSVFVDLAEAARSPGSHDGARHRTRSQRRHRHAL